MRTRQRLTAAGAFTLAGGFIGGGALVTSHTMADEVTPVKGTITVVSMRTGDDEAVRCTYEDVELPTIAFAPGQPGEGGLTVSGGVPGDGPATVLGHTSAGTPPPPGTPGVGELVTVTAGSITGDGPSFESAGGPPPDGTPPAVLFDDANARPGTAEECAAMKPGTGVGTPAP